MVEFIYFDKLRYIFLGKKNIRNESNVYLSIKLMYNKITIHHNYQRKSNINCVIFLQNSSLKSKV